MVWHGATGSRSQVLHGVHGRPGAPGRGAQQHQRNKRKRRQCPAAAATPASCRPVSVQAMPRWRPTARHATCWVAYPPCMHGPCGSHAHWQAETECLLLWRLIHACHRALSQTALANYCCMATSRQQACYHHCDQTTKNTQQTLGAQCPFCSPTARIQGSQQAFTSNNNTQQSPCALSNAPVCDPCICC